MPNVYLIGMMGSGKSVTGKQLALLNHYSFLDLDEVIQKKTGRTISDIFSKEGEGFFRELETQVLREASVKNNQVIATGGGVILRPENIECMKSTGAVIYLLTSLEILSDRLKNRTDRPLLKKGAKTPEENLKQIFEFRQPIYERVCDKKVSTDHQTAEAVAKKILPLLEKA